jgi:hypothetical protein
MLMCGEAGEGFLLLTFVSAAYFCKGFLVRDSNARFFVRVAL